MLRFTAAALLISLTFFTSMLDAAERQRAPRTVRSTGELLRLLRNKAPAYAMNDSFFQLPGDANTLAGSLPVPPTEVSVAAGGDAKVPSFSGTNVQAAGVDEADIIKTDGAYIYQVNGSRVLIVKATSPSELSLAGTITFDSTFQPHEIFADGRTLVVLGTVFASALPLDPAKPGAPADTILVPSLYVPFTSSVKALVYDITNVQVPLFVRELELDGSYITSRRVGDIVYLITRKYPELYLYQDILAGKTAPQSDSATGAPRERRPKLKTKQRLRSALPRIRDTTAGPEMKPLALNDIAYFPGFEEPDFVLVASIDLANATRPAAVKSFLGGGSTVYATANTLYIAESTAGDSTGICKFALNGGEISFANRGEVSGTIPNSFALDEFNGNLRVASTSFSEAGSSNNLFVLNADMQQAGALTGLAPGERIFAARYAGARCYLVTFRRIDPLFVIDVGDPAAPKVLGELKVPGFSEYLHPVGETHLIGLGRDSKDGIATDLKLSLFDVRNPAAPVEVQTLRAGTESAYSEAAFDHKAFFFDAERNLLAFPVTEVEYAFSGNPGALDDPLAALEVKAFYGARVFSLDLAAGFTLKAELSHNPEANELFDYRSTIRRLLRIGETFYAASEAQISAHALPDVTPVSALPLPQK